MELLSLDQIKELVHGLDLLPEIEAGFRAYSEGKAVVPPVGEMLLDKGEVHIKYGCIKGDPYYVIKVASGFYGNPALGLPSGNGMMILFGQHTGSTECILLDEGYLTNVRTAVAGAIAARYLAPGGVEQIGFLGAGVQARMQLKWLKGILPCRKALVWSPDKEEWDPYKADMEAEGFAVESTGDVARITDQCRLIVTTTPSKTPLLMANQLKKGTHITAVGSDTPEKQELDPAILRDAEVVVADSIAQCMERGEIFRAMQCGMLKKEKVKELGRVISGREKGRSSGDQITVADLTGVAVQDINIAAAVYKAYRARKV
jgi:ornithine cyclodeaminase